MLNSAETIIKPGQEVPKSKPEYEETRPKPGREETGCKPDPEEANTKPDPEEANTEPDQEKTNTEPEYEKIKPRPDFEKLFTFDGGYCNPPKGSWYAPGTSGNPNGRPKGSKNKPKKLTDRNFNEVLRSILYKDVKSKDGRTISTARAVTQNLADLALGGNMRAIQLVFTSLRAVEAADAAQQEAEYNYAVKYKSRWENSFSGFSGLDRDLAVPRPDHIILDHINKRAMFTGPRNEEEMFKYLAGEDFREETAEEADDESENVGIEDECPEEMRCEPLPYTRGPGDPPYGGDDERLPRVYRDED